MAKIAAAMGWSLQKVKNEIHRARLQLRARLAGYLRGGRPMTHPTQEELEAVALGEPGDSRAAEIEAHVAGCTDCSRELAWLRTERMRCWAAGRCSRPLTSGPESLRGSSTRAGAPAGHGASRLRPGSARRPLRSCSRCCAPGPYRSLSRSRARGASGRRSTRRRFAALDRAEADYRNAAKVLEGEYDRLRPRLDPELARRWDETLVRARAQLGESRAVAATT